MAEQWLRTRYRCGIVLSEQCCASGETPDVIAWKGACRSVVVECKISRADFFADQEKPFRKDPELAMGCERFYLVPQGLITVAELPKKWGLLECKGRDVRMAVKPCRQAQRSHHGSEDRNLPHPDPIGDPPHEDAAEAGAEPDQRSSQGHHRAIGLERSRDRLQPHDDDQRCAVGK